MRDGAKPLFCWALLLTLTGVLNAIWAGISVQTATFGMAVLAILLTACVLLLRQPRRGPEVITHASFAPMLIAVGFAALMFGFTFGHFIIYFGAGLIVAGLGRLLIELRHQRRVTRDGRA
jgi:hypothetical protein